jgi:hypothetical protein
MATGREIVAWLRERGLELTPDFQDNSLLVSPTRLIDEATAELIRTHKAQILEALAEEAQADVVEHGNVAAVLLESPVFGLVWLVADTQALDEHPDIEVSGHPVLFFEDVEVLKRLRGHEEDLRRFLEAKRAFPRARVVQ